MKSWERQENENPEAYERFLQYLYSKPRSLDRAYAAYTQGKAGDKGPKRPQKAPGQWKEDSRTHNWKERATAWDIEQLTTIGASATVRFVEALDAYADLVLEVLASGRVKPKSWTEATEALRMLGTHISAETIATLRDRRDPASAGQGEPNPTTSSGS